MSRGIHRAFDKKGPTGSGLGVNAYKPKFDMEPINILIARNLRSPAKYIDGMGWHRVDSEERSFIYLFTIKSLQNFSEVVINNLNAHVHAKQRSRVIIYIIFFQQYVLMHSWLMSASDVMLRLINLAVWKHTNELVAHTKPNLENSRISYEPFHFPPIGTTPIFPNLSLKSFTMKFPKCLMFLGVRRETMK